MSRTKKVVLVSVFVVIMIQSTSAAFCEDSAYDLGSEYMDSGTHYDDAPHLDRIREWAGRSSLYLIATDIGSGNTGCSQISSLEHLWQRNPGYYSGAGVPYGIYKTLDGSEFNYAWDWYAYLWDDDAEELCYLREHDREVFFNCIDASSYASQFGVCKSSNTDYALWNISGGFVEVSEDNSGIVLGKKGPSYGITDGSWMALHLWEWNRDTMFVDVASSEYHSNRKRVYAYDNTSFYSSGHWWGGNPKPIFSFASNGAGAIFDFRYNETNSTYKANGTEMDAHRRLHFVNYKTPPITIEVAYSEPAAQPDYCANNEYECGFFDNHLDYETFTCTDGGYTSKTYPYDEINRLRPESAERNLLTQWIDSATARNGTADPSNITFFRNWTGRDNLRRFYMASSPSALACDGKYPASHGYRWSHPHHEAVFAFYDPGSGEACMFKQDRVTDGTNTSNETVWVEFKCAPVEPGARINGTCEDGESAVLYGDNSYFYAYNPNMSFLIAGFNNKDYGNEYGGVVLIESLNATDVYYSGTHTSQSGGKLTYKNASYGGVKSLGWGWRNALSRHRNLDSITSYQIQFGDWKTSDVLGDIRQYWDYNWPYSWMAFNVTDQSGQPIDGVDCTTEYGFAMTVNGSANITHIDYYGANLTYNCSKAGYPAATGVGRVNATNNVTLLAADLSIINLEILPSPTFDKDRVTVTVTMWNTENSTLDNVTIAFILEDLSTGNSQTQSSQIPSIGPFDPVSAAFNWNATTGFYNITVIADPENEIPERNEFNNMRSTYLNVSPAYLSGYVSDGHGHYLADARAELTWDGGSAVTRTNANGRYVFLGGEISNGVGKFGRLDVYFEDDWFVKVVDWLIDSNAIASGFTYLKIEPGEFDKPGWLSNHSNSNARIYYFTRETARFFHDELGFVDIDTIHDDQEGEFDHGLPLEIRTFHPTEGTHYDWGSPSHIDIRQSDSDWSDPDGPDNRERHEFSHHIMYDLYEGMPRNCGGNYGHQGYLNPDTGDSWCEGWATFWPLVISDVRGENRPDLYAEFTPSMEQDSWWQDDRSEAGIQREDFAVAALLWDLYDDEDTQDNSTDTDDDFVSLSVDQIWDIVSQEYNFPIYYGGDESPRHIWYVKDLYDALNMSGIEDLLEDSDGDGSSDLDDIFIAHGFYMDSDNNNQHDLGEIVGQGDATRLGRY